jgi:transformation/transcription domain-associated protein
MRHSYLMLLRLLFKGAASARDAAKKALYAELAPRVPNALASLLALLDGPNCADAYRPLLVELALTLPAPLSALLPLLPKLMRPLLAALRGSEDLAALGLRTLEVWVDSLNPEYLEPAMADVAPDAMAALWALLRPQPGGKSLALAAMTLLGKLGGRSRRWLSAPPPLEYKKDPEHGLRCVWEGVAGLVVLVLLVW